MNLNDRIKILNQPMCLDESLLAHSRWNWSEALYLDNWKWHAYPSDEQRINIMMCAGKLTQIEAFFLREIRVLSWLRPKEYNEAIGGAKNSAHITGEAVDFVVDGVDCDAARMRLKSELDRLDIRMENLPGATWVHIDIRKPQGARFFKP